LCGNKTEFFLSYLLTLSVLRLYSVDDGMISKYRAVSGMRTGKENQSTGENLGRCTGKWMTNHLSYGMA
jgi:hypothetical protein